MGHEGDLTGSEQALRSLEDVLERLKSSSKTSQIPVIVLSGSTDPNAEAAVRQLGADVYLSKPVDVNELLGTLARVLGQTLEGQPQGGGAKTPPV